ncbi:hypothetical protein EV702DRAFT_58885 [Suillus placidus]|uniref:C2H2-type domain-containing protein n=1 Tax=Suillus placidus TaxID=48579 RepID=A0A9P7A089_9AGAM|nr:hypothetical protein EV702DRAFT_58885 [Suillus placidus]
MPLVLGLWLSAFMVVPASCGCIKSNLRHEFSADRRMGSNRWQEELDLYALVRAAQSGFIDNGPLSSQPQQNYYIPLTPVNSYEDLSFVVTQHRLVYGGDSTSNYQIPAPAYLHDAVCSQSPLPTDMAYAFLENGQGNIATGQHSYNSHFHPPFPDDPSANNLGFSSDVPESYPVESHPHSVHDNQSESHPPDSLVVCKWNDGHGPCNHKTSSEGEIVDHLSLSHLPLVAGRTLIKCQWDGCKRTKLIRRDTILRHIRQIDLGIRPRRLS